MRAGKNRRRRLRVMRQMRNRMDRQRLSLRRGSWLPSDLYRPSAFDEHRIGSHSEGTRTYADPAERGLVPMSKKAGVLGVARRFNGHGWPLANRYTLLGADDVT